VIGRFRSIPFPPISLRKILDYLRYVGERGVVAVLELRSRGLDIGKGRGDITRFLAWLGMISVVDGSVSLTSRGRALLELSVSLGLSAFHAPLYSIVEPYRKLIDSVADNGRVPLSDVEHLLSDLNSVARKTVIRFGIDVGAISVDGSSIIYVGDPIHSSVSKCLGDSPTISDIPRCIPVDVDGCISVVSRVASTSVIRVDVDCVVSHIYSLFRHVE